VNEKFEIVLDSVQELLLKLALQMARHDYETRRERQRQGVAGLPKQLANTPVACPTLRPNVLLRFAALVKPSSEQPS
jgi:hypothetical protein